MSSQLKKRLLAVASAACLLFTAVTGGMTVLAEEQAAAVKAGDSFSPDDSKWGTQNNNGWYFMKERGGNYMEMQYHTADDAADVDGNGPVDWMAERFASNPFKDGEMYFISKTSAFLGENGSKPVYAFKAPATGKVELSVTALALEGLQLEIYAGDAKLGDTIALNNTGNQPDGATIYTREAQVKKGDMLYIVGSTTNKDKREIYIDYTKLSAKYLEVETVPGVGDTFSPDDSKWGTQSNNGWYFMKENGGNYMEMQYHTADDAADVDGNGPVDWMAERFASNPFKDGEMYFISKTSAFLGENGSKPVYAFKAPYSGKVELSVTALALEGLQLEIYAGDTKLGDTIALNNTGNQPDGSTIYTREAQVKKGDMLYIVGSTTNKDKREIYIDYTKLSAKYLEVSAEEEEDPYIGKRLAPDFTAPKWGIQNNNGWYFMYQDRLTGAYAEINEFVPPDATTRPNGTPYEIWEKGTHGRFSMCAQYPFLFIGTEVIHPASSANPVKAFKAPIGGEVEFTFSVKRSHPYPAADGNGNPSHMTVYRNNEKIFPTDGEFINITDGDYQKYTFKCNVKKDTMIYFVLDCGGNNANGEAWMTQSAKYLSTNDEVEDTGSGGEGGGGDSIIGKPFTIDTSAENWGKKNNNNWEFMFWDTAANKFKSLAFVRSKDMFMGPSDGGYEYLMIKILEMHPSQKGYPAKVFVAPESGEFELTVVATLQNAKASQTGTGVRIYRGNTQIWPADGSCYKLGDKEEVIKQNIKVRKNERIAVLIDPIDGNIISDATNVSVSAKYLSLSGEPPVEGTGNGDGPEVVDPPQTGAEEAAAIPALFTVGAIGILLVSARKKRVK